MLSTLGDVLCRVKAFAAERRFLSHKNETFVASVPACPTQRPELHLDVRSSKRKEGAMSAQYLKRPNGTVIAVIRTAPNGWQWLHRLNGDCLGCYRPQTNGTFLPNGGFVGWGNLLGTLV